MKATTELSKATVEAACGKPGCIVIYVTENCLFCDIIHEHLEIAVDDLDLSKDCITTIEVNEDNPCLDEKIFMLPTIRICETEIVGSPSEMSLNNALLRARFNDCFC